MFTSRRTDGAPPSRNPAVEALDQATRGLEEAFSWVVGRRHSGNAYTEPFSWLLGRRRRPRDR